MRIPTKKLLNPFFMLILLCAQKKKTCKVLIYRDFLCFAILSSGETGIRTPGTSRYNGFQDRRNRPLCHLSKTLLRVALFFKGGAKVGIIFYFANKRGKNYLDTL